MPELSFCRVVQKFVFLEDYQDRGKKKKLHALEN